MAVALPHVHRNFDPSLVMQRHAGQMQYDRGQQLQRGPLVRPVHGSVQMFISSNGHYTLSRPSFSLSVSY